MSNEINSLLFSTSPTILSPIVALVKNSVKVLLNALGEVIHINVLLHPLGVEVKVRVNGLDEVVH